MVNGGFVLNPRSFHKILCIMLIALFSLKVYAQSEGMCVAKKCSLNLVSCFSEKECRNWLSCILKCGDDKVKCPSFCGLYFQSHKINQVTQCTIKNNCIEDGFSQYPQYSPDASPLDLTLDEFAGTWSLQASNGRKNIFDHECQKFVFTKDAQQNMQVTYSVPLEYKNKLRHIKSKGTLIKDSKGAFEIRYENFSSYHEKWYPKMIDSGVMAIEICFSGHGTCHEYGTIILSKEAVENWSSAKKRNVEHELFRQLQIPKESIKWIKTQCSHK